MNKDNEKNDLSEYERLTPNNVYNIRQKRSALTEKNRADKWLENIRANRDEFIKGNCSIPGLVIFVVGAGPSLEKNIDELKRIEKGSMGKVLCVDAALPYLIEKDIIPEFCISIDADSRMWNMVSDSKKLDTSKITLFCTIATCPELIRNWKGPKYFFMLRTGTTEYDSKVFNISRTYRSKRIIETGELVTYDDLELIFDGIVPDLIPGGNVTAAAYMVGMYKMGAWKIVFNGLNLSWEDDSNFYAGKKNQDMGQERVDSEKVFIHTDMYKNDVKTNASLLSFKQTHEDYAKAFPNRIINATEGGIFGVDSDGTKIKEIEFLTLKESIDKYVFLKELDNEKRN